MNRALQLRRRLDNGKHRTITIGHGGKIAKPRRRGLSPTGNVPVSQCTSVHPKTGTPRRQGYVAQAACREPVERSPQASCARHAVSHEVASECSPGIHPGVHRAKRPKAPEGRQRVHAPARCRPYGALNRVASGFPRLAPWARFRRPYGPENRPRRPLRTSGRKQPAVSQSNGPLRQPGHLPDDLSDVALAKSEASAKSGRRRCESGKLCTPEFSRGAAAFPDADGGEDEKNDRRRNQNSGRNRKHPEHGWHGSRIVDPIRRQLSPINKRGNRGPNRDGLDKLVRSVGAFGQSFSRARLFGKNRDVRIIRHERSIAPPNPRRERTLTESGAQSPQATRARKPVTCPTTRPT